MRKAEVETVNLITRLSDCTRLECRVVNYNICRAFYSTLARKDRINRTKLKDKRNRIDKY